MENRSHALMTGFFTIALIIAAVLAGIWLQRDRVKRVPYEIATTLAVPGLNRQAVVRYRGLDVGRVADIDFDPKVPGQILVRLGVDPDTPVTHTTFATLGYQGVTGIAYIELNDEAAPASLMPSDPAHVARIPLRPGLLDQLEKRGKAILTQTEALVARAQSLMSPANEKILVGAFDNVGKTANAVGQLARQLEPTLARLPDLSAKAEQSLTALTQLTANATRLTKNWDKLATDLQAPDGPIDKLTGTALRVSGSVEGIASDVELHTLPHVAAMTEEARTSLRAVKRTMNTLNERPQSLIFGAPGAPPGPGEAGFTVPTK